MKYEVDTRKKTTKDLESKLVALERRHWEAAGRAEDTKKDLERKHVDKVFFRRNVHFRKDYTRHVY